MEVKLAKNLLDKMSTLCHIGIVRGRSGPFTFQMEKLMTDRLEERGADPGVEEVLDEIVDLEEYAKLGKQPPLSKGYRIRVNGEPFVVHKPEPDGARDPDPGGPPARRKLHPPGEDGGREAAQGRSRREGRSAPSRRGEVQGAAARPNRGLTHGPPPRIRSASRRPRVPR